jgi:hypothetical protein
MNTYQENLLDLVEDVYAKVSVSTETFDDTAYSEDYIKRKLTHEISQCLIENDFIKIKKIKESNGLSTLVAKLKVISNKKSNINSPYYHDESHNNFVNYSTLSEENVKIENLKNKIKKQKYIINVLWKLLPPKINEIDPNKHPLGIGWSSVLENERSKKIKQKLKQLLNSLK